MNTIYWGFFETKEDIKKFFRLTPKQAQELNSSDILLAAYDTCRYEGDAIVIFEKNGKLYEVRGSHCSCYGLEGQWDPEVTFPEALERYAQRPSFLFADQIKHMLKKYKKRLD
jgi:hypothetical protein